MVGTYNNNVAINLETTGINSPARIQTAHQPVVRLSAERPVAYLFGFPFFLCNIG